MKNFQFDTITFTNDVKKHARNILEIATWFKNSPMAKSISLTQCLELVAQASNFKSYSALQAEMKANPSFKWKAQDQNKTDHIKKRELNNLLDSDNFASSRNYKSVIQDEMANQYFMNEETQNKNKADQFFLNTVLSYLQTSEDDFNLFDINKHCSSLLIYVINRASDKHINTNNLFINLALINFVGFRVIRNTYTLVLSDRIKLENLLKQIKFSFSAQYIQLNRVFNHINEEIDFDLNLRKNNSWVDLSLGEIDEPIDFSIEEQNYQIDLSLLKKILNAKKIVSQELESYFLDQLWRVTQTSEKIYDQQNSYNYFDQDESEGISIEHSKDKAIADGYAELRINYIDQENKAQSKRIDFKLNLCVIKKNKFTADMCFVPKDTDFENNIIKAQIATILKVLNQNQYFLANFWGEVFYSEDTQITMLDRYKLLISKFTPYKLIYTNDKEIISFLELDKKDLPSDHEFFLKIGENQYIGFNTAEELMEIDQERDFAILNMA